VGLAAPLFIVGVLIAVWAFMGNDVMVGSETDDPSVSHGTRIKGFMRHGKRLPVKGPNFETYSRLGSSFGRTCLNEQARDTVLDAYAAVFEKEPKYTFTYGETGWCDGGTFWPHHTHQNGLSVDFLVPVTNNERVESTPSTILDGFGYRSEFDADGKMGKYQIDFEAIALHLDELRKAAKKNGLEIERVILDPELHDEMFKTKTGKRLKKRLNWVKKAVWIRHDDHYHVDFLVKKAAKKKPSKKQASKK
jgi:penicillin-insensitive murein endopeptidase